MKKPSADISVELVEALQLAADKLKGLGDSETHATLQRVLTQHARGSMVVSCPVCEEEALSRVVAGKRHIHCLDERCVSNGGWRSTIPTRVSPPDYGPWTVRSYVNEHGSTVYSLQSEDFIFDAALHLSGDFPQDGAKIYAEEMAEWLNNALNARLDQPVVYIEPLGEHSFTTLEDVIHSVSIDAVRLSLSPVEGGIPLFMYPPMKGADTSIQEKLIEKVQKYVEALPHASTCQSLQFTHKEDPEIYCTCAKHDIRHLKVRL